MSNLEKQYQRLLAMKDKKLVDRIKADGDGPESMRLEFDSKHAGKSAPVNISWPFEPSQDLLALRPRFVIDACLSTFHHALGPIVRQWLGRWNDYVAVVMIRAISVSRKGPHDFQIDARVHPRVEGVEMPKPDLVINADDLSGMAGMEYTISAEEAEKTALRQP